MHLYDITLVHYKHLYDITLEQLGVTRCWCGFNAEKVWLDAHT